MTGERFRNVRGFRRPCKWSVRSRHLLSELVGVTLSPYSFLATEASLSIQSAFGATWDMHWRHASGCRIVPTCILAFQTTRSICVATPNRIHEHRYRSKRDQPSHTRNSGRNAFWRHDQSRSYRSAQSSGIWLRTEASIVTMHAGLASGRWREMTLAEQFANLGSEVDRAIRSSQSGRAARFENALDRALELFDLTAADDRWRGPRRREILRAREEFCRLFFDDDVDPESARGLSRYFLQFGILARSRRNDRTSTESFICKQAD